MRTGKDDIDAMEGNSLYQYIDSGLEHALFLARQRKNALFDAADAEALTAYQRKTIQVITDAIGPLETPVPTGFEERGRHSIHGLIVRRVVYQAAAGAYVPALIYKRADLQGKQPGVLFLCGHEPEGKQEARYQEICQLLAAQGLVVLCPEIAGQGERAVLMADGVLRPTHAHDAAGLAAFSQAQNSMRWFMRDAMAALTVLSGLAEVDSVRLMVTGNSGGGTQSMLLALLDDRVRAAAVGTFLSSQQAIWRSGKPQDAEQVWLGTLTPTHTVDHDDLMLAFAPKPLLVLAAERDFFPIDGLHNSLDSAHRAYGLLGALDCLQLYQEDVRHQYTHGMATAVGRFARQHLGLTANEKSHRPQAALQQRLWTAPEGSVQRAWGNNVDLKALCTPERFVVNVDAVRGGIAACMPACAPSFRRTALPHWHGLTCEQLGFEVDGLKMDALLFSSPDATLAAGCDCLLFEEGIAAGETKKDEILHACQQGKCVMVCALTGVEGIDTLSVAPSAVFGCLYNANSWLLRLGKSLAGIRTMALMQLIRYAEETLKHPVTVYAQGPHQLYAHYARIAGEVLAIHNESAFDLRWLYAQLQHPRPDHTLWQFILPGVFTNTGYQGKEGTT